VDVDLSAGRRRLLELLKRRSHTPSELAAELGVTVAGVRQHLDALAERGLVEATTQPPRGRGRPATTWSLTPLADGFFPDRHADLTVSLIRSLRSSLGEEGLSQVIRARDAELVDDYRRRLDRAAKGSLRRRIAALARLRTDEGYMAEVTEDDGPGVLLIENHCPICEAATACTSLCRSELEVFRSALGDDISVEREQHLLSGDRRCVYRIQSARPRAAGREQPGTGRARPPTTRGKNRRQANAQS
jgi:predicted ArsR family transcriptional regulator